MYTITPEQALLPCYRKAMQEEIHAGRMELAELQNRSIENPLVLAYRNRVMGNGGTGYTDWCNTLLPLGPRRKALSLGSGLGRVERFLIEKGFADGFDTIELNGFNNAAVRSDQLRAIDGDLNFVQLPESTYDFVLCHGVLHHLINLEHVVEQINKTLTSCGLLVVYEYIGEDRWQFTAEHLASVEAVVGRHLKPPPRWRIEGFESIRSSEVLPLLEARFGAAWKLETFGGAYFPALTCVPNITNSLLRWVIDVDRSNAFPCYMLGIWGKSPNPPIAARPWTDGELADRLEYIIPALYKPVVTAKRLKEAIREYTCR